MNQQIFRAFLFCFLLGCFLAKLEACAKVSKVNDKVRIAEESAIILWNPADKVEHFIRWANFQTQASDFGFLVPTPSQPTLAEASEETFQLLEKWTAPKVVKQNRWQFGFFCFPLGCGASKKGDKASVRILDQQKVGGFDAVVLEADSPESLSDWLEKHQYASDPELTSWLAPYVAKNWKITAFKIVQDPKTGKDPQTSPVRMSFTTDKPFFPYREPAEPQNSDANRSKRLLRIFFLGEERMEGLLGNDSSWPGKVSWADQLSPDQRKEMIRSLGLSEHLFPTPTWLTTFEDESSPRPGREEVFFQPTKEQKAHFPPHIIHYTNVPIPLELIGIPVLFLLFMYGLGRIWRGFY
jgi:hypothetical protein